jgi:hypothetical protein
MPLDYNVSDFGEANQFLSLQAGLAASFEPK